MNTFGNWLIQKYKTERFCGHVVTSVVKCFLRRAQKSKKAMKCCEVKWKCFRHAVCSWGDVLLEPVDEDFCI